MTIVMDWHELTQADMDALDAVADHIEIRDVLVREADTTRTKELRAWYQAGQLTLDEYKAAKKVWK